MKQLDFCRQAWHDHPRMLKEQIEQIQAKQILEIGAGPNPSVSAEVISQHKIDYHLNDFSLEELEKGNNNYPKIPGNFLELEDLGKYDLICSRMVLEHVKNPAQLHQKIYDHLNPGGIAIHFFATLYALPTFANLILPEKLSNSLVRFGQGRDEEFHGIFPAYYRWCRGPLKGFSKRFEKLGYEVVEHRGYVGHDYMKRRKLLYRIEKAYSSVMHSLNMPLFCSNAILVLRKGKNEY